MKNTYTEKYVCLCSVLVSKMTCLRYYSYLCFLVVQEDQNIYLKKGADLSYRILVQGSVFFLHSLMHLKAEQGVAFLTAFDMKEKKLVSSVSILLKFKIYIYIYCPLSTILALTF